MLLDSESLRCFEAVASTLNFRLAAQRVALSPAAFSDRIRRLEQALETPLLTRTTRQVALTAAGQRLLPVVKQIMAAQGQCFAAVNGASAAGHLELRLGTRYEMGLSWLVPALPELELVMPDLRLHLLFAEGPGLLHELRRGAVDAILTSARIVEGNLDSSTLHKEEYALVGSAELLRRTSFRGVQDAPRHNLLDLSEDLPLSRYFLDQVGGSSSWRFATIEQLGTPGAVRLRLLQGRGIAVLPRYFVADDIRAGRLRRLLPKVTLQSDTFRLVWRHGHPNAEALQRLAKHLQGMPLK